MIDDDYTIDSVPDDYKRLFYEYLNEPCRNSEHVMTGKQFVEWYQQNIEQKKD